VTLEKLASDFGSDPVTLSTSLKHADVEEGVKPGVTSAQSAEFQKGNKRRRLLDQEAGVLRRALAYAHKAAFQEKVAPARKRVRC